MSKPNQQITDLLNVVYEQDAMLDQLSQAVETLKDCWLERTGLTVEDDPYVEDVCSTLASVRSGRLRLPNF